MKIGQALSGADASTNQTSVEIEVGDIKHYGIEVLFTGTPSGTVVLLGSVSGAAGAYGTVPGTSTTVTAGSPNPVTYEGTSGLRFYKVQWTNSAGTGTISVNFCLKEAEIPRG